MRTMTRLLTGIAALALTAVPALAANLVVPSDDYPSIQSAVDAAQPGDTIVLNGTNSDENVVADGLSQVRFKGKKGAVLGNQSGVAFLLIDCSDISISGIVFENVDGNAVRIVEGTDITVSKCMFRNIDQQGVITSAGTRLVISKNTFTMIGGYCIAIEEGESGLPTDCVVSKNRMVGGLNSGVVWNGSNHLIEKNVLEDLGGLGLTGGSSNDANNRIVKNRLTDIDDDAIDSTGDGDVIEKNLLEGMGSTGIVVRGPNAVVTKNSIKDGQDNGIQITAQFAVVSKNKILLVRVGIRCTATQSDFQKNKIKGATTFGILVTQGNNTFTKNSAKDSGTADLQDSSGGDTNDYTKNKFGTESFDA